LADIAVNEKVRRVISVQGAQQILKNVTSVDNTGSWTRLMADGKYVIINPANVLMYIIDGEKVF